MREIVNTQLLTKFMAKTCLYGYFKLFFKSSAAGLVLTYLLGCVVPPGLGPSAKPGAAPQPAKPVVTVDAELISVDDAIVQLGIGKTKFYDLMKTKELLCVKIGRRTLIKRAELRSYIDKQIA